MVVCFLIAISVKKSIKFIVEVQIMDLMTFLNLVPNAILLNGKFRAALIYGSLGKQQFVNPVVWEPD